MESIHATWSIQSTLPLRTVAPVTRVVGMVTEELNNGQVQHLVRY